MKENPPRHPVFDRIHEKFKPASPDGIATPEEKERMKEVEHEFEEMLQKENSKPRADRFLPYLVIRAVLNDNGTRPINVPFWESPDIWTFSSDPSIAPDLPASVGGTVQAGQPTTLYAHVWNLGLAPVVGAKVEFYWFDPTFAFSTANAHLIGMTSIDLPPRSSLQCHKLVKCRTAWVPTVVNGGHECLIARVSAIGDPIGPANEWDAWGNRHVAQRNITVSGVAQDITALMASLERSRSRGMRIQLLQVGPRDGSLPLELLAPRFRVDAKVQTQILAELDAGGRLRIPRVRAGFGGLAADAKAVFVVDEQAMPTSVRRVSPRELVSVKPPRSARPASQPSPKSQDWSVVAENASLFDLVRYDGLLSQEAKKQLGKTLPQPKGEDAQVLRLVAYDGDRLVGGYTIVVTPGR
jgi:hypothetical protein